MKQVLVFVCFFFIANSVYAQDTTRVDSGGSTLSFQPIFGLGLLNGGRFGLGLNFNEIVTIEATAGLDIRATLGIILFFIPASMDGRTVSQGIIFTPFDEKRISFILYNTHISGNYNSSLNIWQAMLGWSIQTGESTDIRMSAGYAKKYKGSWNDFDEIMVGLDFVLTIDVNSFKTSL